MDIEEEVETEEIYLYVDFNQKIRDDVFHNKVFFRLANIESENPLIQLNDHLFKGEYDDCIGTNLFFEDVDEPEQRCIFEGESSIRLKHTISQFKVLSMKPVGIPSKLKDIPKPDYDIKINNEYDYDTLLKKLADNALVLEDDLQIVPKGTIENSSPNLECSSESDDIVQNIDDAEVERQDAEMKEVCENNEQKQSESDGHEAPNEEKDNSGQPQEVETVDILTYKYEKLKRLARRPNRRKVESELVAVCDPKYQKAYEYNSIKSQIVKPSDYFPVISQTYNKATLEGAVDIDRSILYGIIKPSTEYYRILTEEEKAALLSMQNIPNLSMPARYWVLKSQLEYLENLKLTCSDEDLKNRMNMADQLKKQLVFIEDFAEY
ncbi:hypothetical protein WA026_007575 [Henosepilachna vigintioctopunctata]|uniref:Transcription factor TFIIIC triple barrel domain-containing protein n=1 Tax=Henosepilachna vigintioctopunctata TaxID=420089 RepID=A0AAW1UUI0_9CUCU